MKSCNILTLSIVLLLAVGCVNGVDNQTPGIGSDERHIIYCSIISEGSSRTTMNDEAFGEVVWSESDSINVFTDPEEGCGSKYVTEKGGSIAQFKKEAVETEPETKGGGSAVYTAIYPYSTGNGFDGSRLTSYLPAVQKGIKSNFDPQVLITAGQSETEEIGFYNVCGGIRISVSNSGIDKVVFSGNDNEPIAGSIKISFIDDGIPVAEGGTVDGEQEITLDIDDTMTSGDGNYYYITMIPQTLSKGFTMKFHKGESVITTKCDASVTIQRGVFSTVHLADDQNSVDKIMNSEDLSVNGTANCYIINKPGAYKFKAVEGNTDFLPKGAAGAEVLWETDNSTYPIEAGSLIKLCFYSNGYVKFRTPAELTDGNAVIALKDNSGEILWSWHIWICDGYDAEASSQKYKGCTSCFMDRNLGALTASRKSELVNGLYYQWGRKDPFPGAAGAGMMATTAKIKSVLVDETTGTVPYSKKHPDTFILSEAIPYDWYYSNAEAHTLWQESKDRYDPCPYGWKLPVTIPGESGNSSWRGIEKNDCRFETAPVAGLSVLLDSEEGDYAFYPANGYLMSSSGALAIHNVGKTARYWSSSGSNSTSNAFEIIMADGVLPNSFNISKTNLKRYEGHSVRCVKDSE